MSRRARVPYRDLRKEITMNAEEKKSLIRRYFQEVWSEGNLAFIDEHMASDYVNIDPTTPGTRLEGREAFKTLVVALRDAFQQMRMTVDPQYADGDVVITEWTSRAVHRGSLNGLPPTGKSGETTGITVTRFKGDKIAQDHAIWDL